MTDQDSSETKPGPANPEPEGLETATPPGGPQRQDGPAPQVREGHDDDASASPAANESAEEAGGHTIAVEDEQPDPDTSSEEDAAEKENAESSLDQPSQ